MIKNKKMLWIAVPFFALSVASCADTDELYRGDRYIGNDFMNNHYSIFDDSLKAVTTAKASYQVPKDKRFEGSGKTDNPSGSGMAGHAQFVEKHAADATVNGEVLPWLYNGSDIANFGLTNAGELADNSLYEQHQFTQNKKLSLIDSSFSKGILSKLYNGQMRCDAWNSYAYLELDETGYGAYFPKELTSSKYFAMVVRGGSNTPDGTGRLSSFDIIVNFYKHPYGEAIQKYAFTMPGVTLETNISAEYTILLGFYWSDIDPAFDPKGIVGMSVTYSIPTDGDFIGDATARAQYPTYSNMEETHDYYLALMLYEIMFPDSTWSA
jgi:hypothetical protein